MICNTTIPPKAVPIFYNDDGTIRRSRYKCLHGGRGSAKSWTVARVLVPLAAVQPLKVLCAREFQNSIEESVKTLLEQTIEDLGLDDFFEAGARGIEGTRSGSEFAFVGIHRNPNSIRSYEGFDIAWIEEGQSISKKSWEILTPTIRKSGSEIWVTMNPELDTDELYMRLVDNPPANALSLQMNWRDNPWFTCELEEERRETLRVDPEGYRTIWDGKCRKAVEGALYAKELEVAQDKGRICGVPIDPALPVHTGWDLGISRTLGDAMAIWFCQQSPGGEVRLVDYWDANGLGIPDCVRMLNDKGYNYGNHYGPHDIEVRELGTGKSRWEVAAKLGLRFQRIPPSRKEDGIHAVRMLFPRMWFDKDATRDGISLLRRYTAIKGPSDHCADALRTLAAGLRDPVERANRNRRPTTAGSWMG